MKRITVVLPRSILGGILVAVMLAPHTVSATTASDTLTAKMSLEEPLSVTCKPGLNFGETVIPTGERGGITKINVSGVDGVASVKEGDTGVTIDNDSGAQQGICKITGAPANQAVDLSVSLDTNPFNKGTSNAPTTKASGIGLTVFMPNSETTDSNGEKTFNIGGDLTLPNNLTSDNMGAYEAEITITVDDNPT